MPDSNEELTYRSGAKTDAGEFWLSISSENLDPDEIAKLLGMSPTSSHWRGGAFGRGRTHRRGEWRLCTGRLEFASRKSCEEQFDAFLRRLPDDAALWERIAAEHEARVFVWMQTRDRELGLSSFTLAELARRRLNLHIDMYHEPNDETEDTD